MFLRIWDGLMRSPRTSAAALAGVAAAGMAAWLDPGTVAKPEFWLAIFVLLGLFSAADAA